MGSPITEYGRRVFKNRIPQKIFGPTREKETGRNCTMKLHDFYSLWNVIQYRKSIRMGWLEHVAHQREWRSAYKVLMRKPKGKKTLVGRLKHRQEGFEMDLYEAENDGVWGTKLIWLSTGTSGGLF